jgi:hypothetical protein
MDESVRERLVLYTTGDAEQPLYLEFTPLATGLCSLTLRITLH